MNPSGPGLVSSESSSACRSWIAFSLRRCRTRLMSSRNASAILCAAFCATAASVAVASMVRMGLAPTIRASTVTSLGMWRAAFSRSIVAGSFNRVAYPTAIAASSTGFRPGDDSTSVEVAAYMGLLNSTGCNADSVASPPTSSTTHHRRRT